MATGFGKRLRLRLFLEGIEIPIISAHVQAAPNSPTACSIQIPPLPEGTRLLPRTLVHVFFLDDYESKLPYLTMGTKRTGTSKRTPTEYQRDEDRLNGFIANAAESGDVEQANASAENQPLGSSITQYKLLFGGEMVGFVWNKMATSRSLVLQCVDWSNYWDYAYQYGNTGIFGPGRKVLFSGGATNLFTDFLESKGSVITRIVASGRCNSFPKLQGLAAGIIRLMEAIGGVYYPHPNAKDQKRISGQNLFFSTAELRLHITHMVAAFENDPTSKRLLQRNGWMSLFGRQLGGLGGQVSIRKAINALSGVIFHETYGQPCPYYRPGFDNAVSGQKRVKLKDSPEFSALASTAEAVRNSVQSISALLTSITPDQIAGVGGLSAFRSGISQRLSEQRKTLNRLQATAATRRAPSSAKSLISQATRKLSGASTAFNRWRPNAPSQVQNAVTTALDEAASNLDRLSRLTVNMTPKGMQEPARLNQHILRPDIWFGAPPRCNVLFPEDYDSITYQRMFLQEPTRLLLKTNDEFFGEDFLFDKFYFAPQTGSVAADKTRMRDMMRGDVLDHELFTGILPVFEKSGEFNIFASKSSTQQQYQKVGFAQRSANFLYFKYRFNSRRMQVGGKFNPYVACGFPGLIIDRPVDQTTAALHNELREKNELPPQEISKALGTNFLGNFTEVTHSVSQSDTRGRTEIACSYPRQPEESVEFLGASERKQTIRRKVGEGTVRATDVAAINAPKLFSLGPNGGRISNVTEVTASYTSGNVENRVPLYNAKGKSQGRTQTVFVPVGVPTSAHALGSPDVEEQTGSAFRQVVFHAYRVEEEVPRYRREQVDIPAEELIRPGWYGDVWSPPKIGAVYQDFFGTGSITDPQKVNDDFNLGQRVPTESTEQAAEEAEMSRDVNDPRNDALAFLTLDEGSSIQDAVDFLTLTYSFIRQNGFNVDEFIRSYTWRPIASMVDIFGTTDLEFSADGQDVLRGIEGFHSRAFGPYDDLFGLVSPEIEDILGIKRNTASAQKADTRKRKQEAVQQLSAALTFSRGILG